jgi:hypothetical protein
VGCRRLHDRRGAIDEPADSAGLRGDARQHLVALADGGRELPPLFIDHPEDALCGDERRVGALQEPTEVLTPPGGADAEL